MVGLDIGSHTIKGVEVFDDGSDIVVRAAGSLPLPTPQLKPGLPDASRATQTIKDLWASARFQTRKVVLALPPEAVYVKWHQLDVNDDAELENMVYTMAPRGAPFPADEAIVDYRILNSRGGESGKTRFVIMVAAQSSAIDTYLNAVENAGLEPMAVDIGTAAAIRSLDVQERTTNPLWGRQPRAHVIVGAKTSTIAVVRGTSMEFARSVPVGGNEITHRIAESNSVDWLVAEKMKTGPDAMLTEDGTLITSAPNGGEIRVPVDAVVSRLAREIIRSLRFFSSQFAEGSYLGMIGTITLSGGGALLRGLDSCLRQYGVEVSGVTNPFNGYSVDAEGVDIQHVGDLASAYTTAVGLATANYSAQKRPAGELGLAA
jgi:type IV pilus assembly protein PilM